MEQIKITITTAWITVAWRNLCKYLDCLERIILLPDLTILLPVLKIS